MAENNNYLLSGGPAELERLQLQAKIWEPEAEIMLDRIGIQPGWTCVDLGCGAMGILGPLSRRVGPQGRVVGVDTDAKQLAAAREYVRENNLNNVEILELDAYRSNLPPASFDFTHARFVFAPVGNDDQLLREMLAMTRPGGIIAVQEPDAGSWNCYPPHEEWNRLKEAILGAFENSGGDFNAGRRTFGMLRDAGLTDVQIRAAVIALQDRHPYKRLPVLFATSLRQRILDAGMMTETELDRTVAACDQLATDPGTIMMSFIVTQVWGRKG